MTEENAEVINAQISPTQENVLIMNGNEKESQGFDEDCSRYEVETH